MPRNNAVKLHISLYVDPNTTAQPARDLLLDYDGHQGHNNYHYMQMKNARWGEAENVLVDQPNTPESTAFRVRMPAVKIIDLTRSSQGYSVTCEGKSVDAIKLMNLIGLPDARWTPLPENDKHLIEIRDEYAHSHWFTNIRIKADFDPVTEFNSSFYPMGFFPAAGQNWW